MSRQQNRFDAVKVSSACSSSWDAMTGSAQKKFCGECNKYVYDFSQLSRKEADAIMEASRGNLCARISRTADGKIITNEPFPILPIKIQDRRTSPVANAILSAVLVITPVVTSFVPATVSAATYSLHTPQQNADLEGGVATIFGVVTDPQGAVVAGARISLSQKSIEFQKTESNAEGVYSFQNLAPGTYSLSISRDGYATTEIDEFQLNEGQSFAQDVQLKVGSEIVVLGGAVSAPPPTLRVRYIESPLIVDATVGRSSVAEINEHSKLMRTELHVNSFLKGFQSKTVIPYYHSVYEDSTTWLKEGDNVLAFLAPREKGKEGFEINHYQNGIQVLSASEMQAYSARIRELRDLLYHRNPAPVEITDWLVKCSQEPITRWDGVQELLSGFRNLEYRQDEIERCKKEGKPAPVTRAGKRFQEVIQQIEVAPTASPDPDGEFAEALTITHKNSLSNVLFNTQHVTYKEVQLLGLVKKWDKKQVIDFSIHQLKQESSNPDLPVYSLIGILKEAFEDEELDVLVSEYRDIKVYSQRELDDESLSPEEKARLLKSNIEAPAKQGIIMKKIIEAAETLRQKTQK